MLVVGFSTALALVGAQRLRRVIQVRHARARLARAQPGHRPGQPLRVWPRPGSPLNGWTSRLRPGRRSQPVDDLPRFIDDISRRCCSGDSLSAAFINAAQYTWCSQLFAPTLQSLGNGSTLSEALQMPPTVRHDDALLTWHVLKLCARHGGILNEPLDRAAATLRSRQAISHERAAQSAQARLSAKVLTIAPIAFAGWTALTTPAVRDFFASPAGLICVAVGALVNLTGWVWMNRIVSSAA